jgi:hypothetical protein
MRFPFRLTNIPGSEIPYSTCRVHSVLRIVSNFKIFSLITFYARPSLQVFQSNILLQSPYQLFIRDSAMSSGTVALDRAPTRLGHRGSRISRKQRQKTQKKSFFRH